MSFTLCRFCVRHDLSTDFGNLKPKLTEMQVLHSHIQRIAVQLTLVVTICAFLHCRTCVRSPEVLVLNPAFSVKHLVSSLVIHLKMKQLTVITCSMKKIAEIKGIFGAEIPFEIIHEKLDLDEYQGDGDFIVREKCKLAAKMIDGPVLVEDTSVTFTALSGLPGVYIKWFDETIGSKGMWRILKDFEDKSATAISKVAFCESVDGPVHVFEGKIKGTIVEPRGDGFTWTSCFLPDGQSQVFDEMDLALKNKISERFYAVSALKEFLLENYVKNGNQ